MGIDTKTKEVWWAWLGVGNVIIKNAPLLFKRWWRFSDRSAALEEGDSIKPYRQGEIVGVTLVNTRTD